MRIYVSPSTQEHNIGVGNYGTEETRMNELCDYLIPMLKKKYIVYRNDRTMTLSQVIQDSNNKNVDLHIAIHSNACNGKARGCEVLYCLLSSKGAKIAKCIYDELEYLTPSKDRGIKPTITLAEVRKTKAPSVIIEVAFHDNANDAKFITTHRQALAKAIYNGIVKYLEV